MAHITEDRVFETSVTTGTGAFTLDGAVAGYRAFADVATVGDTFWYAIWRVDVSGSPSGQYEVGLGTYSAVNTLTRTTVLESSNAGAAVTFLTGTKQVALTLTAVNTAQFDNVGAMWLPAASAEPPTPATGNYLYAKQIVPGNTVLKSKRPSGVDSPLQDSVAFNRIAKYVGGQITMLSFGGGQFATSPAGTSVTPLTSGTSIRNALARTQQATAATANAIAVAYINAATTTNTQVLRGSINGEGGFRLVMRFGLGALATGNRFFAGLRDVVTIPVNVDPFTSTTPGSIGLVANTATDANWRIAHSVSGTAKTTISLGANFPVNNSDLLELVLFCRPFTTTAGDVSYRVRRYTTTGEPTFEATGTISTNLPAGTTFLYPTMWMVNVAASVANFQINTIALESDF
jgi:hypothetical protein